MPSSSSAPALSSATPVSPALQGRETASGGQPHAHHIHAHPTHAHHAPAQAPQRAKAAAPRIGTSILRLSLAARLGLALALMVPLWVAVVLVVG